MVVNAMPAGSTTQLLECDIVMAGGVTSGIVYPGAVAMIAKDYRFRSIGGTSVGAIAAAVTAAAEFGRQSGLRADAFDQLADLHKELGASQTDGQTRLFHLFTAERRTRALLSLILPFFSEAGKARKAWYFFLATLRQAAVVLSLLAALACGAVAVVGPCIAGQPWGVVAAIVMSLSLLAVAWTASLGGMFYFVWYPAMRDNYYGICIGKNPSANQPQEDRTYDRLTSWMHARIQAMAGLRPDGPPLTFGNLWSASGKETQENIEASPRQIDLAMITSDISRSRMAQLPFLEFPTPLYVELAVLEDFFPPAVVDWMKNHAAPSAEQTVYPASYVRWPRPQDLPIVVAARMSLSFPVLLSAIPLLAPDYAARQPGQPVPLRRVWFSDGGLVSNFPIHFFDSPLPSRPTFCLNLVDFERDLGSDNTLRGGSQLRRAGARTAPPDRGMPPVGAPVWQLVTMTKGNAMPSAPFTTFDRGGKTGAIGLLQTLLTTARGWSDNQLLLAPGVRERVVNVGLRNDEGGLNLAMTPDVINDLDYRGRAAGGLIAARFNPTPGTDPKRGTPKINSFPNHRWVRYRNVMAAMEDLLRRFARARRQSDQAAATRAEPAIAALIAAGKMPNVGYHPLPTQTRPFAAMVTRQLERAGVRLAQGEALDPYQTFDVISGQQSPASPAPSPKMRFQLRPLPGADPRAERGDPP